MLSKLSSVPHCKIRFGVRSSLLTLDVLLIPFYFEVIADDRIPL